MRWWSGAPCPLCYCHTPPTIQLAVTSMSKSTQSYERADGAPSFEQMVRANGPITLGEAKQYATQLPLEQQKHPCCACYKVTCPTNGCCCKGGCVGLSCNLLLGGCLWYGCWFCACNSANNRGIFTCTDLKGNTYNVVKVDGQKAKWACFGENEYAKTKGDQLPVTCYCE